MRLSPRQREIVLALRCGARLVIEGWHTAALVTGDGDIVCLVHLGAAMGLRRRGVIAQAGQPAYRGDVPRHTFGLTEEGRSIVL